MLFTLVIFIANLVSYTPIWDLAGVKKIDRCHNLHAVVSTPN